MKNLKHTRENSSYTLLILLLILIHVFQIQTEQTANKAQVHKIITGERHKML